MNAIASLWGRWARPPSDKLPVRDHLPPTSPAGANLSAFDRSLVLLTLALLALGLVMVYSASIALPDNPRFARYAPTHFLLRHAISLSLALVLALLTLQVPVSWWEKHASAVFVVSLLLLVLVLVPHVGLAVNGARRWLPLGVMNFQPSELAKLAIVLYAAGYMVRKMDVKEDFLQAVWPMAVALGVIGLLLLAEPDMGAFLVIAMIALGILFLGGVNGRMFALGVAVLAGAFVLMIVMSPWRAQRIFAYLDPWNPLYAQGKAYQLTHSLIAFGRGEIFGQGLGSSVEKLHYLPEAHTDFLLAVIGEELGFVGVCSVIVAVLLADPAHLRHRPPGGGARPRLRRADGAGRGHLDGRPGLHQHGRQPGRAADQGADPAADELRRLGDRHQPDRAGHRAARGHRESNADARGPRMSHLVIMAAGTGGHVIPGLAVAREMQQRGWSISWLGTLSGMENRLVPAAQHRARPHRLQRPARQRAGGTRSPVACGC